MHRGKNPTLFDHLVGASEQHQLDVQAEGLRGLQIDDRNELRRLLDRDIAAMGVARLAEVAFKTPPSKQKSQRLARKY